MLILHGTPALSAFASDKLLRTLQSSDPTVTAHIEILTLDPMDAEPFLDPVTADTGTGAEEAQRPLLSPEPLDAATPQDTTVSLEPDREEELQ